MPNQTSLAEETAVQVLLTVPLVMRIVSAELRHTKYNLVPAQLGILTFLAHRTSNLSELAENQAVSLPTMSATVSKMSQNGWVERRRSPTDRRVLLIEITDEGRRILEEIVGLLIQDVTQLLDVLPAEELKALSSGLAVLEKAFQINADFLGSSGIHIQDADNPLNS